MNDEPKVFVVDDDPAVRDGLALLLSSVGHAAECFESASDFLECYRMDGPGCLIVDLRMPGISGLDLQDRLKDRGSSLPIIFLTGHGDVPTAVRALKGGAVDFLQKPFEADTLLTLVARSLGEDARRHSRRARRDAIEACISRLTPRELEVMEQVTIGNANKVIAAELDISERTVELHRSRLMRKLRVRSVPELMRMLQALGEP